MPVSTKTEREFIQELRRQDRRRTRWVGGRGKGGPDFQKAVFHFPLEYSRTPPTRSRSAPPCFQVFRGRASPPPALPRGVQVQSRGGLAGSRPLARILLPLRPGAAKTPRHPRGTVFSSEAWGGRCALSRIKGVKSPEEF